MEFALVREIDIQDEASWRNKIFLTFDMEWASDESIRYLLDKVVANNAKATLFCTHPTSLIDELKNESWIELGVHPNFNFLINGDFRYGKSIDEVVTYYKEIVPESQSIRSHCATWGSLFSESFSRHNFRFDSSFIIPASARMLNKPWLSFYNSIINVPILWEDDVHCMYEWEFHMRPYMNADQLMVFNFHPVTTVLNIDSIDAYYCNKEHYADHAALVARRNQGMGVDNLLEELLHAVRTSH